jgi:hypothetical protein
VVNDAPYLRRPAVRLAAAAAFRALWLIAVCGAVFSCAATPDRDAARPAAAPQPAPAPAAEGDLLAAPPDAGTSAPASRPRRDAMLSDLLEERR